MIRLSQEADECVNGSMVKIKGHKHRCILGCYAVKSRVLLGIFA